jgi:hypothetical protein
MGTSQETSMEKNPDQKGIETFAKHGFRAVDGGECTEREGKYLTFSLAEEEYGIGILRIKEIIGMMSITEVKGSRKNNFTFSAPIHLTQQCCENVGISRYANMFAPC